MTITLVALEGIFILYLQNTLQDHEQTDFLAWFKTRSLLLLAELVDKRSSADAKIIVGCTHISAVQTKSPSMQTLQVRQNCH